VCRLFEEFLPLSQLKESWEFLCKEGSIMEKLQKKSKGSWESESVKTELSVKSEAAVLGFLRCQTTCAASTDQKLPRGRGRIRQGGEGGGGAEPLFWCLMSTRANSIELLHV